MYIVYKDTKKIAAAKTEDEAQGLIDKYYKENSLEEGDFLFYEKETFLMKGINFVKNNFRRQCTSNSSR